MIVADFLDQLCETGKPVFENSDQARDLGKPAQRTVQAIVKLDQLCRIAAPGEAPQLNIETAHHGAVMLLQLSRFFVFRELDERKIETEIGAIHPALDSSPDPSATWSADLALQHLPALHVLAMTADNQDPLIAMIRDLASAWPLSGIGISEIDWEEVNFAPVLENPCLRGILVDRILAAKNPVLIRLPEITPLIRKAVGDHQKSLAPWLSDSLKFH